MHSPCDSIYAPFNLIFRHANYETISRPAQIRPRKRRGAIRPHGRRHNRRIRGAGALRPARFLSAVDNKEAPHALDNLRAVVVLEGRHQHKIPERQPRDHLGRVGRQRRQSRAHIRGAVDGLEGARRPQHQPDRQAHRGLEKGPFRAQAHRERVESRRATRCSSSTSTARAN